MVKTPKGELTGAELRKLIRAHNILVSIKIPKGTDREGLIKLIEGKGYKVDHKKKAIIDSKNDRPRRPKVTLDQAKELTKPKPLTEEQKKKRQQAKQKKAGEKAFLKTVIPKPPPASKPSKGVKVKKPAQPNKKAPEPKPLPKKEAPKKRRKLKGRLTGVREKTTEEIEKLYPEFYAEDKGLTMRTRGYIYDVLSVYHKIKSNGTAEQKKEARKVYDAFRGYKGSDKGELDTYKKQFEMILKKEDKKVEEKKEDKKVEEKKKKTLAEMTKKEREAEYAKYEKAREEKRQKAIQAKKDKEEEERKVINTYTLEKANEELEIMQKRFQDEMEKGRDLKREGRNALSYQEEKERIKKEKAELKFTINILKERIKDLKKKKPEKKEEPKKEKGKFDAFDKVVEEVKKEVPPIIVEWLKIKKDPKLVATLKDKDGNFKKKVKGGRKPLFVKEQDKYRDMVWNKVKEIYKRNNVSMPKKAHGASLFARSKGDWKTYGGLPEELK